MWVGGWTRGCLDDMPPSDDVIPPLAQVHLLGRGTGQLSFRSSRLACDDAVSAAFGRLLCKSRLPFLPLLTYTVIRRVESPAATALRLLPRSRASIGEVDASTSDVPGCLSSFPLRVTEALAALALQRIFWRHIRLHSHSQAAEFGERSHF